MWAFNNFLWADCLGVFLWPTKTRTLLYSTRVNVASFIYSYSTLAYLGIWSRVHLGIASSKIYGHILKQIATIYSTYKSIFQLKEMPGLAVRMALLKRLAELEAHKKTCSWWKVQLGLGRGAVRQQSLLCWL